ncbi:hypothetical protein PDN30_15965 [Bacillus cereus]|nr:hypothetical protein [Bacillus cereus]
MGTVTFYLSNINQVQDAKVLDILIGTPPKHILIFTGIPIPFWDSFGDIDCEEVIIKFGLYVKNFDKKQYTATVGLADIYDGDNKFIFGTGEVWVDAPKGELELHVKISVYGSDSDSAKFSKFSYQAIVLADEIVGTVTGNIRWNQGFSIPKDGSTLLKILAQHEIPDPP